MINCRHSFGLGLAFATLFLMTSFSPSDVGKKWIIVDNYNAQSLIKENNCVYVIYGRIDLGGNTIAVPSNCVLDFQNGSIINGSVLGRDTQMNGLHKKSIGFNAEGSWLVPKIEDSYFDVEYLTDDQVLSNVNVMQSDKITNKIILKKESYTCSIKRNGGYILNLTGHTKLKLNSTIAITGNSFTNYNIIRVFNKEKVKIVGGILVGDVGKHKYVEGSSSQWGHGLLIYNSKHVRVERMAAMNCIGDGFTITGGDGSHYGDMSLASSDILLNNVVAKNNRRQGLSIIHAENVTIKNSTFSDTGAIESHSPSAGIDIEPNLAPNYQTVQNIKITNCTFERNVGRSILANHYEGYEGIKSVSSIRIDRCHCDGRIELYTGGIEINNTSFKSLEVYAEKDPINGLSFNRCVIGENGILLHCLNKTTGGETGIYDIQFNRCTFSLAEAMLDNNEGSPAVLGGKKENIKGLTFNKCKIAKIK